MEILINTISIILFIAIIASPVLILIGLKKLKLKTLFIFYINLGFIITSILTLIFAWWTDTSKEIMLDHYGYNFEAMNESERFKDISEENLEKVKHLEISMMGVGWPLKAFMTYIFYLPYLFIVYFGYYIIIKYIKRKKTTPNKV